MDEKGFTLLEHLIVIIIVGIMATLAIARYSGMKERTLDDEAKNNLKLIQRSENIYRVENGTYYPPAGNVSVIAQINSNLGLNLSAAGNRNWNYAVWSTGCSRATRNVAGGRSWYFTIGDADNIPDAGVGCP